METVGENVIPKVSRILEADISVMEKIKMFVNQYIDLILQYPMIPGFLLAEMQRNPEWIINLIKAKKLNFDKLNIQIEKEIAEGKIRPFKLEDLFASVLGMCLFPIFSKPVLMEFIFDQNEKEFYQFIEFRKTVIMDTIESWLKIE